MNLEVMETTGEEETSPEARLWQAVIVRTVEEWISGPLRRKREAEDYLFNDQEDFAAVCGCAGMDSGRLRSRLAKLRRTQESLQLVPAAA